jgi:hypothetical protein
MGYEKKTTRRSAGSHSDIDIEGYHLPTRTIFIAQCKKHKGLIDKEQTQRLKKLHGLWTVVPYDIWGQAKGEKDNLHIEPLLDLQTNGS